MPDATIPRWWPNLQGKAEPEVTRAIRILYDKAADHDDAFTALNNKVAANAATAAKANSSSGSSTSSSGSSSSASGAGTTTSAIAAPVNNQTGTTYATQASDKAGVITFNNASATAVSLNSSLPSGYYTSAQNIGAGTVTLTPSSGSINGGASLTLTTGFGAFLFFDGTNWVAVTSPTSGGSSYSLGGPLFAANIVLGPGAGTGATVSISGLDGDHHVQLTTGSSPTVNAIVWTVTYTASRGSTSYPILEQAANFQFYTSMSQAIFPSVFNPTSYSVRSGPVALTASTSFAFNVSCP